MANNDDEGNRKRPALLPPVGSAPTPPAQKTRTEPQDVLTAILARGGNNVRRSLFRNLSVAETMALGAVSKGWNAAVQTESVVPKLTGVRTNTTTGQRFWTTDAVDADKRYFKPMSGDGITSDVPHVSEQASHPSHATDVGVMQWASSGSGKLPPGPYPTKVQFQGPVDGRPPYTLGAMDVPAKADGGRVLVPAPPEANEKPNTLIPTRDYSRALDVPKQGPLPASRQRTIVSTQEASKPLEVSRKGWQGATITGRDKPKGK